MISSGKVSLSSILMRLDSPSIQKLVRTMHENDFKFILSRGGQSILEHCCRGMTTNLLHGYILGREELKQELPENSIWYFGSCEQWDTRPPISIQNPPPRISAAIGSHHISQPFVCEFRDVHLVGRHANARVNDGRYILEADVGNSYELGADLILNQISGVRRRQCRTKYETLVPLINRWSHSYYHWFTESLPRLRGIEYYREQTGINPKLLINSNPPDWMVSSLRLIGYEPSDWVEWDGEKASVDRLIVPSLPRETWYPTQPSTGVVPSARGLRWVREKVLDSIDTESSNEPNSHPEKIYISRDDSLKRRVVNESSVVRLLSEYGFESVTLTGMGFKEQVRLFAQAEAVIAPHGAGLTNIIYASSPTVIELFGEYVNNCYYILSSIMKCDYGFLQCESKGEDMTVNLSALDEILKKCGQID